MFEYSKETQELLFKLIYSGKINTRYLPELLYKQIGQHLDEGVLKGFGVNKSDIYNVPDSEMLRELRENTWIFSGAKTYQEVRELSALMIKDGELLPFSQFKNLALEKFELYNSTYLATEYEFATGQSQSARAWSDFEANKEFMPVLVYRTVNDGHVSEICQKLDGFTDYVDSPAWNTVAPKNHWRCRCILEQGDLNDHQLSRGFEFPRIDDEFRYNPGKSRIIFSPDHPYFQVEEKDKEFAKRNFNLPIQL